MGGDHRSGSRAVIADREEDQKLDVTRLREVRLATW
jgi:hypothetical protein